MPINTPHPEYVERLPLWTTVKDAISGEPRVKSKGDLYLTPPPGMIVGRGHYDSATKAVPAGQTFDFYLKHAEFPELISPTHGAFCGIVTGKSPTIKLPEKLRYLVDRSTRTGESLESLWNMIVSDVLITGRCPVLVDVEDDGKFVFVKYDAEGVINWHESMASGSMGLEFAVCQETLLSFAADPFRPVESTVYRELRLSSTKNGPVYSSKLWAKDKDGEYKPGSDTPISTGGRTFNWIPLYPFSAKPTSMEYGPIPMIALARICVRIYRLNAAYKRALIIKCDPQPVITGVKQGDDDDETPTEIGGQSVWIFESSEAKAYYLDINGDGIPFLRDAINDEYKRFQDEGGKLLLTDGGFAESGEAVKRRSQYQHVTLKSMAIACGKMMELMLKDLAEFVGESRDSVIFSPDTDFAEPTLSADSLLGFIAAINNGAPLSKKSVHEMMRRGGVTSMTLDDELIEIESEVDAMASFSNPKPDPSQDGRLGAGNAVSGN